MCNLYGFTLDQNANGSPSTPGVVYYEKRCFGSSCGFPTSTYIVPTSTAGWTYKYPDGTPNNITCLQLGGTIQNPDVLDDFFVQGQDGYDVCIQSCNSNPQCKSFGTGYAAFNRCLLFRKTLEEQGNSPTESSGLPPFTYFDKGCFVSESTNCLGINQTAPRITPTSPSACKPRSTQAVVNPSFEGSGAPWTLEGFVKLVKNKTDAYLGNNSM